MSQPHSFYVLGAGASFGLVPTTPQLKSFVAEKYREIGIYPTEPAYRSALYERIIGNFPSYVQDVGQLLLRNIAKGTLDLLVQRGLWRDLHGMIPPQYEVFNLLGYPATIFNFNLDGLGSAYCELKHIVLEPHGTIDRYWLTDRNYKELLEETSIYNLKLPHITPKILPSPEPSAITSTQAYIFGRRLFRLAPAVLLIGYSFGRYNDTFDDAESFEYFVDLLKMYPRPVFVLSPSPDELVELIQQRLSSYDVYPIAVRWEILSSTILAVCKCSQGLPSCWCNQQLDTFERLYYDTLETNFT